MLLILNLHFEDIRSMFNISMLVEWTLFYKYFTLLVITLNIMNAYASIYKEYYEVCAKVPSFPIV